MPKRVPVRADTMPSDVYMMMMALAKVRESRKACSLLLACRAPNTATVMRITG